MWIVYRVKVQSVISFVCSGVCLRIEKWSSQTIWAIFQSNNWTWMLIKQSNLLLMSKQCLFFGKMIYNDCFNREKGLSTSSWNHKTVSNVCRSIRSKSFPHILSEDDNTLKFLSAHWSDALSIFFVYKKEFITQIWWSFRHSKQKKLSSALLVILNKQQNYERRSSETSVSLAYRHNSLARQYGHPIAIGPHRSTARSSLQPSRSSVWPPTAIGPHRFTARYR